MLATILCLSLIQSPTIDWKAAFESETAEVIATGLKFTEGPCWVNDAFLFCEVNADKIHRFVPGQIETAPFMEPSGRALGLAFHQGTLYLAQHGKRQIGFTKLINGQPGEVATFADQSNGKKLIDTNDVVVAKDGTVYFTDPQYFNQIDDQTVPKMGVYRVVKRSAPELLTDALDHPNGLALSLDEKTLFVAEHAKNKIHRIELKTMTMTPFVDLLQLGQAVFISGSGRSDGIRFDAKGNLFSTGPGGIYVIDPKGALIAFLVSPRTSNLAFGGSDGKTLLLTRGSEVATIRTKTPGAGFVQK